MKTTIKLTVLFFAVLLSSCCKQDDKTETPIVAETPANVYVTQGDKLYINDVTTTVSQGNIRSCFLKGNDIYLLISTATGLIYTKNGVPTVISSTLNADYVDFAVLDNNIVLVIGGNKLFTCRPEGTITSTNYGANDVLLDIAVENGSSYIVGYERGSGVLADKAKYWNSFGGDFSLTDGSKNAKATAIVQKNGNSYIVGYEENSSTNTIKFWKNRNLTNITENIQFNNNYNQGLNVYLGVTDKEDVYIATTESIISPRATKGIYWKNGVKNEFYSVVNTGVDLTVSGMATVGNDFYISGAKGSPNTGTYWKNGVAKELGAGYTTSIFVTKR
jgi:hypothetical protein